MRLLCIAASSKAIVGRTDSALTAGFPRPATASKNCRHISDSVRPGSPAGRRRGSPDFCPFCPLSRYSGGGPGRGFPATSAACPPPQPSPGVPGEGEDGVAGKGEGVNSNSAHFSVSNSRLYGAVAEPYVPSICQRGSGFVVVVLISTRATAPLSKSITIRAKSSLSCVQTFPRSCAKTREARAGSISCHI